jgi:hypothetical protein
VVARLSAPPVDCRADSSCRVFLLCVRRLAVHSTTLVSPYEPPPVPMGGENSKGVNLFATPAGPNAAAVAPAPTPTGPMNPNDLSDPRAVLHLLQSCVPYQPIHAIAPDDEGKRLTNADGTIATGAQRLHRALHFGQLNIRAYDLQAVQKPGESFACFWPTLPDAVFGLGLSKGANPNALARTYDGISIPVLLQMLLVNDVNQLTRPKDLMLMAAGAEVALTDPKHGNSLLHIACFEGFFEQAIALIQRGVDVNARNKYGDTPLLRLLRHGTVRQGSPLSVRCDAGLCMSTDHLCGGCVCFPVSVCLSVCEAFRCGRQRGGR